MEVVKTHVSNPRITCESNIDGFAEQVAANRGDSLRTAIRKTWARGGVPAFYQGLVPWVSEVVVL